MNISLWILQGLLAAHTLMGAVWKLSNPERTIPSLVAIPHGVWLAMSGIEILLSLCLILPAFNRSLGVLAPIAAICIAVEMLFFCALHLRAGIENHGHMIYWLVVAAICALLAYGRFVVRPL